MASHLRASTPLAAALALALAAACSSSSAPAASSTSTRPTPTTTGTRTTPTTTTAAGRVVVGTLGFALPSPSARAVLVADATGLLLLGGLNASKQTVGTIVRIDPRAGTATPVGALATAVHDAAGALVDGRATVFGGGNTAETATVQAVGADGRTEAIGRLPIPRSDLAAATVGGRTFLVGGYDGSSVRATTIATTDGSSFQVLGDLPTPVRYAAVTALGTDILVVGGTTTGNAGGAVRAIQLLDTRTGAVRAAGTLPFALTDAVAATLHGRAYVIGGIVDGHPSDQVWRVDPEPAVAGSYVLTAVATLPVPLSDAAVAVRGDTAYVAGGESPAMSAQIHTVEVR